MITRPQDRATAATYAAACLLSLVLVYGLIASPLMVECIPWGGSTLVELLGQDPCHHWAGHGTPDQGHSSSASGDRDNVDPCLDLVLDNIGVTQTILEPQAPPAAGAEHSCHAVAQAPDFSALDAICFFRLAREPVFVGDRNPLLTVSLRI